MKRLLLLFLLVACADLQNDSQMDDPHNDSQLDGPVHRPSVCAERVIERCAGPPMLQCMHVFDGESLTLSVVNSLDYTIVLESMYYYDDEEPYECMSMCDGPAEFSRTIVEPGEKFEARFRCRLEYIDQGFELAYSGPGGEERGYFLVRAR